MCPPIDLDTLARDHAVLAARTGDFTRSQEAYNQGIKHTLYGRDGTSGLQGKLNTLEQRFDVLEKAVNSKNDKKWQIWALILAAALAIASGVLTAKFTH